MAAQSLLLPSLSLQLPIATAKPKTLTLAFPLSSSNNSSVAVKHLYLSHSIPHSRKFQNLDSGVVRRVAVSSEFEQEEEEVLSGEGPDLKLFVGNLPFSVNSNELTDLFENAGTVETAEVIYDKTGRSRGFAFVTMSTVEEVEEAVQQFNGYELSGRALRVNSGPPPPKDELPSRGFRSGGSTVAGNRVYVGNLSWDVQDSDLETLFSEQGRVVEAKVVYDRESGRSRGFGFVTYSSSMEVNNAVSSLDGVDLDGRRIRVSVAEERPRRQF